jgi:MYXO-CTERM domain-containing protein
MYGLGKRAIGLFSGVAIALLPSVVGAVRAPAHLVRRPALETASGQAVRQQRMVRWDVPADFDGARTLAAFKAAYGPNWNVLYDDATNVPLRLYGEGIAVPGSIASAAVAERAAYQLLAEQIDLLAPGSKPSDFVVRIDDAQPDWKMRSIAFTQTRQGVKVQGGEVTFTFKADRLFEIGSTAIPNIQEAVVTRQVSDAKAIEAASRWVASDVATNTTFRSISAEPVLLPLVQDDGKITTRTVLVVTLDATQPTGRWDVYVDVASGNVVARRQTLMFATATVNYDVPDRYPTHGRVNKPARGLVVSSGVTVGADGKITFSGTSLNLAIKCTASFVRVLNAAGAVINTTATIMDGGTLNFSRAMTETDDSQLQTFISSGIIKARMKVLRPQLTWLDQSYNATVNENDVCNAYSDGTDVHFFKKGTLPPAQGGPLNCENTGRILDVTMHETGHSFHNHVLTTGQFEGGLSEGISDYFAMDITEDPRMGKGFFSDMPEEPIRDADQTPEVTWPIADNEVHAVGVVIASALWDGRKNFKAAQGQAGVDLFGKEFADALARAVDSPSMYTEILASDDNDGNLANGTPNKCLIDEAFARHNLAQSGGPIGPQISNPVLTGQHVKVAVAGSANAACPGVEVMSGKIDWKVRGNAAMSGSVAMTHTAAGFEADLPTPADSIVLNYKVTLTFADNTTQTFPDNLADPYYETYIGETEQIFCTNFETDAFSAAGGWTHALVGGTAGAGADDWMWGVPAGTSGSADPNMATSGTHVIGNDLGGTVAGQAYNGIYQASKSNQVVSPVIDLMGHTSGVHLQYKRWLNVEDGSKDKGEILVDGNQRWVNTSMNAEHTDKEWRFHDVDLSADAADGKVQITYKLTSDATGNRGGWTIDDFCIVATKAAAPGCGDGHVDSGEECDDGNTNAGDGCSATCQNETPPTGCGNGTVDPGVGCDDGNTTGGDGCSASCQSEQAVCGNGHLEVGETCDDSNTTDGDGCSASCQIEGGADPVCGNGVVETGEQCDDGNDVDTDTCKSDCTVPGSPAGGDGSGGCGCTVGGHSDASGAAALLLLLAGGGLWFTRRRRSRS